MFYYFPLFIISRIFVLGIGITKNDPNTMINVRVTSNKWKWGVCNFACYSLLLVLFYMTIQLSQEPFCGLKMRITVNFL